METNGQQEKYIPNIDMASINVVWVYFSVPGFGILEYVAALSFSACEHGKLDVNSPFFRPGGVHTFRWPRLR